jgi:hypothetical protein
MIFNANSNLSFFQDPFAMVVMALSTLLPYVEFPIFSVRYNIKRNWQHW